MTNEYRQSSCLRAPKAVPSVLGPDRAEVGQQPFGLTWRSTTRRLAGVMTGLALLSLASCGGDVTNEEVVGGQKLSFAYYQKCINPILTAQLPIPGTSLTNTCAAGGCHDSVSGSGGALRIVQGATNADLTAPINTDVIHKTDMYKNFVSAQGQVVFADPAESRLVTKPLVKGVLHGGGRIFADDQDADVKLILYWMSHPAAQGQNEFSLPEPTTCTS
jgi:hypothetical protein